MVFNQNPVSLILVRKNNRTSRILPSERFFGTKCPKSKNSNLTISNRIRKGVAQISKKTLCLLTLY